MYQWECFHSGGRPIGICQHGFQYGACCQHKEETNEISSQSTTPAPISPTTQDIIDHHTDHGRVTFDLQ